jgi:hypothetical protein
MSALSRLHTNRILQQLQAVGFIECSYNHIRIADPDGLVALIRRADTG